jgi:hypothetical protein
MFELPRTNDIWKTYLFRIMNDLEMYLSSKKSRPGKIPAMDCTAVKKNGDLVVKVSVSQSMDR